MAYITFYQKDCKNILNILYINVMISFKTYPQKNYYHLLGAKKPNSQICPLPIVTISDNNSLTHKHDRCTFFIHKLSGNF